MPTSRYREYTFAPLGDACLAQIHGGLWAWPCFDQGGHAGPHSWEADLRRACVCHSWVDVTSFGDVAPTYKSTGPDALTATGAAR